MGKFIVGNVEACTIACQGCGRHTPISAGPLCWLCELHLPVWFRRQLDIPHATKAAAEELLGHYRQRIQRVHQFVRHAHCN